MLARIAHVTWHRPRTVLAVVGAFVVVAAGFGVSVEHHLKAAGFTDRASESERAARVLQGSLGFGAEPGVVVLVRAKDGGKVDLKDAATRLEVARIVNRLRKVKGVGKVDSVMARDGRSVVLGAHLQTVDLESEGGVISERIARDVRSPVLRVGLSGYAPAFNDVNDQTRDDLTNAELIAFPALTILLLLVFRGVIAAALPLLIGVISILGAFLVLRIMSAFTDTSLFALNITTALSLGLAVDYALLLISRYREELERDGPTREAHHRTVLTAGRTALFSGSTVAVAMASLIVMPQRFLYSIGVAGAAVGVLSALVAVLVIPSLLAVLGERVNSLAIRRGPSVADASGRWYRMAHGVMRRPVAVGLLSAGLMLGVASPGLSTVFTGPSAQAVSSGLPSYEPTQYIAAHYPRSVIEPVSVVARGVGKAGMRRLAAAIRHIGGVTSASQFVPAGPGVAVATAALDGPALSGRSQDAVRAIRHLPAGTPGGEVLVGGNTAGFLDQKQSLRSHAPLVLFLLASTTMILLFFLTGSVILPVKTLLMTAATLVTTIGFLVLAFQHEWLSSSGPPGIEIISLVFLSAVTVALSTDYAVLVLSRIKEQHDRGETNVEAVATGIGRTGRIISAAAVMIAVVFLAFAVSPIFFMKQIAVGMAVSVIVDATIVRGLLVPALMRLLGDWNWWAPAPMARLQRRYGLKEG